MRTLKKDMAYMDREFQTDKSTGAALEKLNEMRKIYHQMEAIRPSEGNQDLFKQYCEVSLGMLADVEEKVQKSYWQPAERSFARIQDLRKDIDAEFVPSISQRFFTWLKNIFKRPSANHLSKKQS